MKSLYSWLLTFFAIMFWMFRVGVAVFDSVGVQTGIPIPNGLFEVILLFTTLACIVLIIKRIPFFGLVYFLSYAIYFGMDLFKYIMEFMKTEEIVWGVEEYTAIFVSLIAILLSFGVLADLVFNRHRGNNLGDKKTDWFFKGTQYDRTFDERADRNEYKTK